MPEVKIWDGGINGGTMKKPVIMLALLLAASAAVQAGEMENLKSSSGRSFKAGGGNSASLSRPGDAPEDRIEFPDAAPSRVGDGTDAAPGDLIVTVDRFTAPNDAPVFLAICDSEKCHNLQDKGYKDIDAALLEAGPAARKYKISGLRPGEYSISGFNDMNKNGVMDTGMFGIPKEPAGFSKLDTDKLSSNPSWDSVKFTIGAVPVEVTFHLIHKFGL